MREVINLWWYYYYTTIVVEVWQDFHEKMIPEISLLVKVLDIENLPTNSILIREEGKVPEILLLYKLI